MDPIDRFNTMAGEFRALSGWLISGEGQEPQPVIVRCFQDEGGSVRVVMEHEQGAGAQLVINGDGLARIAKDPQRR